MLAFTRHFLDRADDVRIAPRTLIVAGWTGRDEASLRHHIEELATIVRVNAAKLNTPITDAAAHELARRSRGTPRVANSRLYWTRNYSAALHDGNITEPIAKAALDKAEVDSDGLDKNDRKYLETLIDLYGGGPTGVEALAATINLASDTLSDEIEPYLLREQYITRSPRGRVAMPRAYTALGKLPPRPKPEDKQGSLFE